MYTNLHVHTNRSHEKRTEFTAFSFVYPVDLLCFSDHVYLIGKMPYSDHLGNN